MNVKQGRRKVTDTSVEYFRCPFNICNVGLNGVKMEHKPSGAHGEACDAPHREKNEEIALERLKISQKYRSWENAKMARQTTGV